MNLNSSTVRYRPGKVNKGTTSKPVGQLGCITESYQHSANILGILFQFIGTQFKF